MLHLIPDGWKIVFNLEKIIEDPYFFQKITANAKYIYFGFQRQRLADIIEQ